MSCKNHLKFTKHKMILIHKNHFMYLGHAFPGMHYVLRTVFCRKVGFLKKLRMFNTGVLRPEKVYRLSFIESSVY